MSQTQNGSNPYTNTNSYPTSFEPPSNFGTTPAGTASLSGSGQINSGQINAGQISGSQTGSAQPSPYSDTQYSGFSQAQGQGAYTAPASGYGYQSTTTNDLSGYNATSQFSTQQGTGYDMNNSAYAAPASTGANSYTGYGQGYDQAYTQYNSSAYNQTGFTQPGADTMTQGVSQNMGQNQAMTTAANSNYMGGYGTESNLNTMNASPTGTSAYNYSGYDQNTAQAAQYGAYGYGDSAQNMTAPTAASTITNPGGTALSQTPPINPSSDPSNFTVSSSGNRNFYIVSGVIIVILVITTVVLLVVQAGRNGQNTSSSSSSSTASIAVSVPVSSSSSFSIPGFNTSSISSVPALSSSSVASGMPIKKNNDQKLSAVWLKQKFPQTDLNMDGLCANPTKCGETVDPDLDGLSNIEEYNYQTDPLNEDTAGSGISDGDKIKIYNLDPNRKDSNGNGTSDGADIVACLDPLNRSGSKLTQAQQKQIGDNTKLHNLNSATIKTLQSAGATSQDLSTGLILANCGSTGVSSMPNLPTPPPIGVGSSSSSSSAATDDNDVGISFN